MSQPIPKFMPRWLAGLAVAAVLVPAPSIETANAADQGIRARVSHERVQRDAGRDCGCCGCWYPEYVQHREILYAYPSDPRYTLTSERHYTLGRMYSYVDNW